MRPNDPFDLVAELNPVPDDVVLPHGAASTEAILDAIDWRTDMATPQKLRVDEAPHPRAGHRVAIAAFAGIAAIVLLVVGLVLPQGRGVILGGGEDPEGVLAAYEAAFNAKDIEAVMELWADDAVLVGDPHGGTPTGSAIELFESVRMEDAAGENGHTFHDVAVTGDSASFDSTWVGRNGRCKVAYGHTIVVADGQIARWEYGTFEAAECE